MDFSLEELERMLDDVQETKVKQKLSERNTIDILQYLKSISDLTLITDKDGKNFYTEDALERQIFEHVTQAKKIRLNELERWVLVFKELVLWD